MTLIGKLFKTFLLTILSYLLQVTVARHIAIGGVAPNLALALIAVVAVSLGHKYTFCMSLMVGYLLEIMLPALDYINLILYPVCAMLSSLLMADKSERRLEEERAQGKRGKQWNPHLRTLLCAAVSTLIFEIVSLVYIYLSGVSLTSGHYGRAIFDVVYTTLLASGLQFPIRWWLGVYKLRKAH